MRGMKRHLLGPVVALTVLSACSRAPSATEQAAVKELASIKAIDAQEQKHLALFEDFDINVYSRQKWDFILRSHATDIVVHWPDGRTTKGVEHHLVDLRQQFVFAPDAAIKEHPIKIAQGNWTTVVAIMTGTFTQPMPIAGAKPIAPTNLPFRFEITTIGRWDDGVMKEKWLMWDNPTFMRQVGLMR
jgi:SnoaL-like polyketide cyclase